MKKATLAPQFEAMMQSLLSRIPFLKLKSLRAETQASSTSNGRSDWLADVRIGEQDWTIVIECKQSGQPRLIRNDVFQLESYLRRFPQTKRCYGVLTAPFISEESARICTEAGMGYADLAGNAHLSFDHVFIDIRTGENPFREKRELRSLFTPKVGRILKVLLTPPLRAWKVEELSKESGVSLGHVSNVRKRLLDMEWGETDDSGLRLTKPEDLAKAWQDAYEPHLVRRTGYYTVFHGEQMETAIRSALAEAGAGEHAVLSSYSAAHWIAPYARQGSHFFYADDIGTDILRRHLQLEPAPRGENVVIAEPREDDIFTQRIEPVSGIWCTGLVQTWLDLSAAGERGIEAAEHLLQHKLSEWKEMR